jgi:hypothetical protein
MNIPATCYGFPCLHCDGTGKDDDNGGEDCLWCGGTGEAPEDDCTVEDLDLLDPDADNED